MRDRDVLNSADIETVVIDLVRRELHATARRIEPQTRFVDDLGVDSLALIELTLAFEETFDIDIPDEEATKIRTVRDAILSVEECLRVQHPE
jgi:acyl carrier protein